MGPTDAGAPPAGDPRLSRFHTRGQGAAAAAALDLVTSGRAHALLFVGEGGVGKTTLALDVAAVLLCTSAQESRPCRACRGCRLVESGNHPDLHRLAPEGPGGQIRIGARADAESGTVRRLIVDLALLPVEGGARVVILENAERMNEDAQSALLKTLEEPPTATVLILCAHEEERLLPTVRSRCARVRLGPLGPREIEALLGDLGAADAPTAARLGRLAGGRPGIALAWAAAPAAVVARGEMARTLLDLLGRSRAERLPAIRALLATAADAAALVARGAETEVVATVAPGRGRAGGRRGPGASARPATRADAKGAAAGEDGVASDPGGDQASGRGAAARRNSPAERRRALALLLEVWRDLARDVALAQLGPHVTLRDPAFLEEVRDAAAGLPAGAAAAFLVRLERAGELLGSNVSPELLADSLVLAWPRGVARR